MTRDDILRFAYTSKITNPDDGQIKFGQPTAKCLEQFANLVAAAEREACAAAAHNALLEMGQPYGVCKVAVDSIKERNNK